jgi:glyoxylase-like metal-dependent hydrolase (beta-lactamase superfamily II)
MSKVRLLAVGVGEAFTARYYTSCLALGVDKDWLLIDCPHPSRKMLREASIAAGLATPLDIGVFHGAVVSHLHADHCCGLEDFGFFSFFALRRRARILMHPDASAQLWDGLLAAGMGLVQTEPNAPPVPKQLADFFELIDLNESRPVQFGPFSVDRA